MYHIIFDKKYLAEDKIMDVDKFIIKAIHDDKPIPINSDHPVLKNASIAIVNIEKNQKLLEEGEEAIEKFFKECYYNTHTGIIIDDNIVNNLLDGNSHMIRMTLYMFFSKIF